MLTRPNPATLKRLYGHCEDVVERLAKAGAKQAKRIFGVEKRMEGR